MKKSIILPIFLAGIFGPVFGTLSEERTKNITTPTQKEQQAEENSTEEYTPKSNHSKPYQVGIASWYGPGFYGKSMSNGNIYTGQALTVAHRTLPLNKKVRIRNLENGKMVIAKVTDRGPYIPGRIVDLSTATAKKLGVTGLARVALEVNI